MAEYLVNLTTGQMDEKGIYWPLYDLLTQSGVLQSGSMAVSAQGTPDMTVKVAGAATGHGIVFLTSGGDMYYGRNTANKNVTITSNASGVTKTDAIVAYADLAAGIATSNNPGALKFVAVRRSGSNTGNPTSTEIEAAVGASNPYVVLAYVTVSNGASSINSGNITDARTTTQLEGDRIETGGVTTAKIADAAVTTAKVSFSGASVCQSAGQSIPNAAITPVAFDTENFDTAAYHSTSSNTSRLTIPTTGIYLVSFHLSFAGNATGIRYGWIAKNGSTAHRYGIDMSPASASGDAAAAGQAVLSLSAGDYIEIMAYQTSGGSLNTAGSTSAQPTGASIVRLGT